MTPFAELPPLDRAGARPGAGPATAAFDELLSETGAARGHWQPLLTSLERLGRDEFALRAENGRRILREHGVSFSAPGDPEGVERPWELDFLPLLLPAAEWRQLERGLIQRALLLNTVLGDLHSTQRLVRDGFVPAPLVYANPGYLRACQAIRVPGGAYLQSYAADLARSPDGSWWVLADRTQAPSGIGFAQESRTVVARVLPEAMQDLQPRSLAATFRIRRDALRRLSPQNPDSPTIVLLTPGPRNEAYFEHAYLARLLGLALVEGDDLTVRDRRVFIKTLDGLRGVDVILRRVADAFCDPLELRADSLLGVPGLVEASRAGHVAIANALGSGLLESPAFLPFLPSLCRHVLGEELRLPAVATWWCGQRRERDYVSEHLEELVVRSAYQLGGALPPANPDRLRELFRARPHEFVGQEQVVLSRTPVATAHRWESRPFVLRVFVLFDGASYTVMPGGLARLVSDDRLASMALSLGGPSKDVWVLPDGDAPGGAPHFPVALAPVLERLASDLPSRTADNFFWLGRYTERLEHIVRVARCAVGRLADDTGPGSESRLAALGELLADLKLVVGPIRAGRVRETLQSEVLSLLHKEGRAPGVRELLKRIHLTAFAVRYRLSSDTWRILNRLEPDARQRPARLPLVQAASLLNTLVLDLAAFSGMSGENMTRGHGWGFLDLGRRLERVLGLAKLLAAVLKRPADLDALLDPVLEIADSVMTYRRRYFAQPRLEGVLDLLLLEASNPRSLAFQVARLEEHAATLPAGLNPEGGAQIQQRIVALADRLRQFDPLALGEPRGPELALALLGDFTQGLPEVSELATQVYFSHVRPQVN